MLDAIIVIAQYARDQALALVSPHRIVHGEHIICDGFLNVLLGQHKTTTERAIQGEHNEEN